MLVFVQLNVAPIGLLTNVVGAINAVGQTVMSANGAKIGFGFTVTEKTLATFEQPLKLGLTVILPNIAVFVLFVLVNEIFPLPFMPSPMAVLSLSQAKVVPLILEVKLKLTGWFGQTDVELKPPNTGNGFTVIVNVVEYLQPSGEVAVPTIVAVWSLIPAFIPTKSAI